MDALPLLKRTEWLARLLVPPVIAGLILAGIYVAALFEQAPGWSLTMLVVVVAQAYVLAEGVRLISRRLGRRLPWASHWGKRISAQLAASLGFACSYLLVLYVPMKLYEIAHGSNDQLAWPHLAFTLLVALAFGISFALLQLVFDLVHAWQQSELEAETLRRASMRAQLDALKAQINPHFFFNSLNVLYGLIEEDAPRAQSLVLELSEVFRYVLRHGEHDLVPARAELEFVEACMRILRARHGDALQLLAPAAEELDDAELPPMSLQLLVENAVRHNQLDPAVPLTIHISRSGPMMLRVSNPIRPRRGATPGTGIGLANLGARYRLFGAVLQINEDDGEFVVHLPLLPPGARSG